MRNKRIYLVITVIFAFLILLLGRLAEIQLFSTEKFTSRGVNLIRESISQRSQEMILDDGRGVFLDRAGKPLTHTEKYVLVLFPFLRNSDWKSEKIAEILEKPEETVRALLRTADKPLIAGDRNGPYFLSEEQAKGINSLKVSGAFAVKKKYTAEESLAGQLIGVYGENEKAYRARYPEQKGKPVKIGLTGLQQSFDEIITGGDESRLVYHVNGLGQPLFGIDVRHAGQANPYYPLHIQTTIDSDIQKELENLADLHGLKKGGIVLLDVPTNNIIALVSRPAIDMDTPYKDDGVNNLMFSQLVPGSVFKTVVATASIEEGMVDKRKTYNCSLDIRGKKAERNLGKLDFESSFSRSCNKTFADLANDLVSRDPHALEHYAKMLGVLGSVSWEGDLFQLEEFRQFRHAEGHIFSGENSREDPHLVAQTGIGQQEVRLSPISVANMMGVIARGGVNMRVRAVSEIQYANGTTLADFDEQSADSEQIAPYTAMKLQQLLRGVVTDPEGTGHIFHDLPWEVAGKSGTAETGVMKNNVQLHHKWFAGYFPYEQPRYALVTVNMDVSADEGGVNPLYADIVRTLHNGKDQDM